MIFWTAGQMGPGTPGGMLYTTGRGTVSLSADGTFTFSQQGGRAADLCVALAGG